MFKEEESFEILKILDFINNIEEYQKIYNVSQAFNLENIDETRKYFIEEIKQNWIDE